MKPISFNIFGREFNREIQTPPELREKIRVLLAYRDMEKQDNNIYCAQCRHVITGKDSMTRVNGSFDHAYVNPAGILYHIGCFKTAPGCSVSGEPTGEFTWFPGFQWSYAFCGGCGAHLGWYYASGVRDLAGFFGLIFDRLVFF